MSISAQQFLGGTIPTTRVPVLGSESKIIKDNQPLSSYDSAMGEGNTEKGIIPQAVDTFKEGYDLTKEGANNPNLLEGLQQIGRGTLKEAGAGIRAAFSPIEAGLKIVSQLPGFHQALGAIQDYVINPASDENSILTSKPVQDFMMSNPHADQVIGDLITIVGTIAGGKKAPEIKGAVGDTVTGIKESIIGGPDGGGAVGIVKDTVDAFGNKIKGVVDTAQEKIATSSSIPAKVVRRVEDTLENRNNLKQQPKPVQTAVKADIPQPQAELIHDATNAEKALMKEMLEKQKTGTKKLVMKPEERPDAVIGKETMKTVNFLENQKNSAIIDEGEHVNNLAGQPVDFTRSAEDFNQRLSEWKIKPGEKGKLDFSDSEFSGPSSAKDRSLIQLAYDKLQPNEMGQYIKPADELHTIRQLLFNETKNKTFTEPFSDKVVNVINNDKGNSLRSGLLHDIAGQVKGAGPGYAATATKNAIIQDALETFYKLVGKDANGREINIKNLSVGEVANRLEGNASAKIENAFQKIEAVAQKYGYKGTDVSIRKLVAFKTILKNILGDTQHNSLAGGVEQGVKAALPDAAEIVGNVAGGNKVGAGKAILNFVKGNTKAEQIRALEELLNSINKKTENKAPSAPSANSIDQVLEF